MLDNEKSEETSFTKERCLFLDQKHTIAEILRRDYRSYWWQNAWETGLSWC